MDENNRTIKINITHDRAELLYCEFMSQANNHHRNNSLLQIIRFNIKIKLFKHCKYFRHADSHIYI